MRCEERQRHATGLIKGIEYCVLVGCMRLFVPAMEVLGWKYFKRRMRGIVNAWILNNFIPSFWTL